MLAAANAVNHRDKLHSAASSTCSRDCCKYLVPLPFCREHPGMRILQLCGAEQGVWGFAQVAFSLCRLFVPCVSLGAARAWQVPLHRALASPKQPRSSSVSWVVNFSLSPPASWGNPTDGCRGQMQVLYITENPVQQLRFGAASPSLGSSSCRGKLLTAAGAVPCVGTGSAVIAVWGQQCLPFLQGL